MEALKAKSIAMKGKGMVEQSTPVAETLTTTFDAVGPSLRPRLKETEREVQTEESFQVIVAYLRNNQTHSLMD